MINYKEELNDSQYDAVTYCEGPSLVIAGAGSGKTRVLTYKIAYLLEHGYQPWNILALTFTNKAAREMKTRIEKQVGSSLAAGLWMGTFHSIFARILRIESQAIGFSANYTIYDSSDQKSLLKAIIKEMELDDKVYKAGNVASHISNAKNHLVLPDQYAANPEIQEADASCKMPRIADIYNRYWLRCKQANAMDFDDLLLYTSMLFHYHPEICQKYANRFQYVLVDEYQDTNVVQHSIVWQLTKANQRVCVVGDDAQSIYSFRGAEIGNILKFNKQYTNAKLFKLEQNYRSTKTIVQAANSLIDKNSEQIKKAVFSENSEGDKIPVYAAYSDIEEAEIVARKIVELHNQKHIPYDGFAILYRTNAQSRTFEESFRKHSLPYRIFGGLSFYQRKEVKDVIAYFRLVVNPNDEEAFKRIVNYPARGIGDTTVKKITDAATLHGVSLWSIINAPLEYGLSINKGTHVKLQGFKQMIAGFIESVDQLDAYELGQRVVRESGVLTDIYADNSPENMSRQANVEELVNGMHDFVDSRREEGVEEIQLRDFLSEVSLLSDLDTDDGDDQAKITLMTVHSAKGLEFNTVFVVGMENNLFPSSMAANSFREMEEERRLFYVAITRAEERCFLSFARSRFRYGKTEICTVSPFIKDIDARYLYMPQDDFPRSVPNDSLARFGTRKTDDENGAPVFIRSNGIQSYMPKPRVEKVKPVVPPNGFKKIASSKPVKLSKSESDSTSVSILREGSLIEHERFGLGEVLTIVGEGDSRKATVRFRNTGEKQLLLKFARFTIIE